MITTEMVVRFPFGRYHGTAWGRHVNEGAVDWPPSPWRLLRALYAVWKERRPALQEDTVCSLLGHLAATAPDIATPPGKVAHTRHYMPDERGTRLTRSADLILDTFVVMDPRDGVRFRWPVHLPEDERRALAELVSALSYFGRADSVCSAELVTDGTMPDSRIVDDDGSWWRSEHQWGEALVTEETEVATLLAPLAPLDLDGLLQRPSNLRSERQRIPTGAQWVRYCRRRAAALDRRPVARHRTAKVEAVRFRLAGSVLPRATSTVALTHFFRAAVMSKLGNMSPTFSGHDERGPFRSGHQHAHFLAFSADRLDTRLRERPGVEPIDTVAVWVPGGIDWADVRSLGGLRSLWAPDEFNEFPRQVVSLEAYGPVDDVLSEISGPSRIWESVTPFVPGRFSKQKDDEARRIEELTAELAFRPHLAALASNVSVVPLGHADSWRHFRRSRPLPSRRVTQLPASGVRLEFSSEVHGPIVLGRMSHFGLGLFAPRRS